MFSLLCALLCLLAGPPVAGAAGETAANAAGRYDGLVLRDLGGKTAAVVQLVADGGAFTPVELWRSKTGAFDVRKATFVAGDVNGDGIGDGIVLYDLGGSRSRLYVFISDGQRAVKRTAWTSRAGVFARSRAKLAVGDLNRDGCDDVIALYDRGHASAALYRFVSKGTTFTASVGWSARRGTFSCAKAQLAAGDFTGGGRDDALVLYRSTTTSSRLYVFASGSTKFTKKMFWRGAYAAGRAKLAAGDVDSDGHCDAITLYRKPDNTGRIDVFRSSGTKFAKPAVWYGRAGDQVLGLTCRFAAGDVTGDGRADVVLARPAGSSTSDLTTFVSDGTSFVAHVWWEGAWTFPTVRLAVAPSPGLVVSDAATVLDESSTSALRSVSANGTFAFAGETAQLGRVRPGDVLLAAPDGNFPGGICRKVTAVSTQGGRLQVSTTQATLAEVIDQGEVAFDKRITAGDMSANGIAAPGVSLLTDTTPPGVFRQPSRGGVTEGFGFGLSTTVAEIAEIEGSVWLDPAAYVDWDVGWTGVESASYTQTLTTTTDLTVSLKKSLDTEVKQTIYKQTLAVITIMVGPVPVVVTPEFEVYVGASGEVTAGVTAGMSLTTDASLGIAYDDDDGWSKTTSFTYDITPQPPQLFGSLELKGFAGAGLSFKVYAVAGPEAKIEPYVSLEAATNKVPWWTLKGGVDTEIGFKVEAFDITMLEVTYTFNLFEYVIDKAGSGSGAAGGGAAFQLPSIRGSVLDTADSTGLGGAVVTAREGAPPGGAEVAEVQAAADGTYILWGLDPGVYTVAASRGGYADNLRTSTVVSGDTTLGQDILLAAVATQGARGRVVSQPGGAGLDGVYVGLHEGSSTEWSWPAEDRYTWGGGTYQFAGLAPGEYWLIALESSYFSDKASFTVTAGHTTVVPDLHLVPYDAQGLGGTVTSALDGAPVAGATIELHEQSDAPAGELSRTTTTAADGSWAITGVAVGDYTVVGRKAGYIDGVRNVAVAKAEIAVGQDVEIAPFDADGVARAVDGDGHIRYVEGAGVYDPGGALLAAATYEFWFSPAVAESGHLAAVSMQYGNLPGGATGNAPIMEILVMEEGTIAFGLNQNDGSGPLNGTWHFIAGQTEPQVGVWYHVAAQCGEQGMKLFVNGHLEASDPYTGGPEPDWSDGTLAGGWFSVGDNDSFEPGFLTLRGSYKELRVSAGERYAGDFVSDDTMTSTPSVMLLDHLIGGTSGQNYGMVWVP
jgi:hypothetical protein